MLKTTIANTVNFAGNDEGGVSVNRSSAVKDNPVSINCGDDEPNLRLTRQRKERRIIFIRIERARDAANQCAFFDQLSISQTM